VLHFSLIHSKSNERHNAIAVPMDNFLKAKFTSPANIDEASDLSKFPTPTPEVAGVTFSDSDSAPVPKFLNLDPVPGPAILQIWESDSCSDSGYNHRSNRNLPMFLPKKWPHRLLLLPKWKIDSGSASGFHKFSTPGPDPGSKEKRRILSESNLVSRIQSHLCPTP